MKTTGNTVLITGGGTGIGLALAAAASLRKRREALFAAINQW